MKKLLNKVHRNIPQVLAFLIDAWFTVVLFGRATGKTFGVTSTWIYKRARALPRSTGFICSPSYTHLIDTIVPEMENGWRNMGLREGVHYWKYEKPPKELGIPEPFKAVDKPKYFIFWLNGSVTKLVSLDRKALVNSQSFDYGAICEGRKCKGSVVSEDLLPTIRGGRDHPIIDHKTGNVIARFHEMPEHGSVLIESDLPRHPEERWILRFRRNMDKTTVKDILQLQKLRFSLLANKKNEKKIKEIDALLQEMRRDLTYVAKATSLDNIHVLGERGIKNLRKSLSGPDYDVSVLGIEQEEVDGCFYAALSRSKHGYHALNEAYIEKMPAGTKRNWRFDKDIDRSEPLIIGMDCNAAHNCFNINQLRGNTLRQINYMYNVNYTGSRAPDEVPEDHLTLVDQFAAYYQGITDKNGDPMEIKLVYNNTLTAGEKYGLKSKAMEIAERLKKHGFKVKKEYVGQGMWHDSLHKEWDKILKEQGEFRFTFNLANCDRWYECCKDAPIKIVDGRDGQQIKKNKKSETDRKTPPEDATHATEGQDTVLQWLLQKQGKAASRSFIAAG